ncbi:MAG TPA: EAL domain-containing protein [Myxococcota bacterium]|nr:EAL domain-containing protein [Myxococcota bacterium]
MDERPQHRSAPANPARRRSLGEDLQRLAECFEEDGALGVVLIDASGLAPIEPQYGGEALHRAMGNLGDMIQGMVGDRLTVNDAVVVGEIGRDEIAVFLFRALDEIDFFKRDLDRIRRDVSAGLAQRGNRAGYPYMRHLPPFRVGSGTALRNPTIRPELQIRRALEDARDHIGLEAKLESRKRRKQILELLLERRIYSVYEPIVEVSSRTVFGYEALARGPDGTELHSPATLFAIATEQDLVFQLDCLCRQSGLDGARDLPGGAKLFLNVRPSTIHDPNFRAEALERTLQRCKLAPSDVVFEISEQESIANFDIFREVRDYYGKLGFKIALDDVGAGYASLEAVMEIRPEFIKVDRAFCAKIDEDPGRQHLLRALQSLADRIGARIIGEGLDTLEELVTLGRIGIHYGQGWLFGKPHRLRSD